MSDFDIVRARMDEAEELVEGCFGDGSYSHTSHCLPAYAALDRIEAENRRLRNALEEIAEDGSPGHDWRQDIARQALEEE